jgi:hypothetical protein
VKHCSMLALELVEFQYAVLKLLRQAASSHVLHQKILMRLEAIVCTTW